MANLSTAFGDAYITAPTKEDCNKILQIIDRTLGEGDYFTELNIKKSIRKDGEFFTDFDEKQIFYEELDEGVRASCSFNGCGRWDYRNNVERSPYWIKNSHSVKEEDIKYLESLSWSSFYEFTDYEPGCMILGRFYCGIEHESGIPLEHSSFIDGDYDMMEMSWYNIMDVQGYTVDELLEERYVCEAIFSDGASIDEYEDDLLQFIRDCAFSWNLSREGAKARLCALSEDFSKLIAMVEDKS